MRSKHLQLPIKSIRGQGTKHRSTGTQVSNKAGLRTQEFQAPSFKLIPLDHVPSPKLAVNPTDDELYGIPVRNPYILLGSLRPIFSL